jgi:hypothetical protein
MDLALQSVRINYGGQGYSGSLTFDIAAPPVGGVQAVATATIATGVISSIQVTNPGQLYTSVPIVDLQGGGSSAPATAVAQVASVGVGSVTVGSAGRGYTSPPVPIFLGGGGTGTAAHSVLNPTTVASIAINDEGTGYTSPPACTINGGGGLGATAQTTLRVVGVNVNAFVGGYLYGTTLPQVVPNVTIASADGNGSGATATATLQTTVLNGEAFSLAQANTLITELEALGTLYAAGIPIPVATRATSYKVPPKVNFGEVDKAARYAASVSTGWFPAWPATWSMTPSSDPTTVMTQRAIPLATALATYVAGGGVPDPFFASIFSPLYLQAVPAYGFYVTSQREATSATSSPYSDSDPIAVALQALITEAEEMASYLNAA